MPNSTRREMQLKIDYIFSDLKNADELLTQLIDIYKEQHPDYSNAFLAIKEHILKIVPFLMTIQEQI